MAKNTHGRVTRKCKNMIAVFVFNMILRYMKFEWYDNPLFIITT